MNVLEVLSLFLIIIGSQLIILEFWGHKMDIKNDEILQALLEVASKLCTYENSLTNRILQEEELLFSIQKALRLFSLDSSNHEEKKTEIIQRISVAELV